MTENIHKKLIVIVGPTASGKTAVGVKLAKEFNGEIISTDSRQIFRGLDIGTGKDLAEYGEVKYHMIDIVEPCTTDGCRAGDFNLFKYLELARAAIEDIFSRGKTPIIVGGTGLYVQALVEGFHLQTCHPEFISGSQNQEMLKQVQHDKISREQLNNKSIEELQTILKEINLEVFENLADPKNPHRLIRAIEKSQGGEVVTKLKPDFEVLQIGLDWSREELNKRIDKRVDDRFEQGMLSEIIGLLRSGVNSNWLIGLGLEYRIITDFILNCHPELARPERGRRVSGSSNDGIPDQVRNDVRFEEMKNLLKLRSHQYAKRQMTWFKRFPEIVWEKDLKIISKLVKNYLN